MPDLPDRFLQACTISALLSKISHSFCTGRPAEIVNYPETGVMADFNSGLNLTCVGYGLPQPDITWFRDDLLIMNSSDATIFGATPEQDFTQSVLELCPLQRGGNYSCVASNVNGSHPVYFQVTVNRAVKIIVHPETSTTADFNSGLTLTCVGHGVPLPAIAWFRDVEIT